MLILIPGLKWVALLVALHVGPVVAQDGEDPREIEIEPDLAIVQPASDPAPAHGSPASSRNRRNALRE
ncbi:MAG TPA: hypothetical protein VGG06_09565 [Thermoanaerobaculia bacterium]|jgi:hypothetical protein